MNRIATSARWACRAGGPHRRAFTLTELLFVMMILAILAALSLSALSGATQQARIERTRAIINRIDKLITEKYDSYRTRAVPIRINPGTRPIGEPFQDTAANNSLTNGFFDGPPLTNAAPQETFTDQNGNGYYDIGAAELRLLAIRELMRSEMPNSQADVFQDPLWLFAPLVATPTRIFPRPALSKTYLRRANAIPGGIAAWTGAHESAECLYLIISAMRDGEDSALDFFAPSEIGDIDNDGMKEIWDAFGNPIEFVRWPAGYSEHPNIVPEWGVGSFDDDQDGIQDNPTEAGLGDDIMPPPTSQTRNYAKAPDPFDPLRVDGRYRLPNRFIVPFALKPLVYSYGPDREPLGIRHSGAVAGLALTDPYGVDFTGSPAGLSAGSCYDASGGSSFADNITNHDFSEK